MWMRVIVVWCHGVCMKIFNELKIILTVLLDFSDETTVVTTQPRLERQVVSHPNRCSELYVFTELLGVCGVIGSLAE